MSLTFVGTDGAYGWDFAVEYTDGSKKYLNLGGLLETYAYEFDRPIVWAVAWVYNEWTEDYMDFFDIIEAVPSECPPPVMTPVIPDLLIPDSGPTSTRPIQLLRA